MKIQTRSNKVADWNGAAENLIQYYFNTTDISEIKSRFGNKRVIRVMNMYFRVVK